MGFTRFEKAYNEALATINCFLNDDSKYSVYFNVGDMQHRNDAEFAEEIKKFLREVE
jgi:hypothetical protein